MIVTMTLVIPSRRGKKKDDYLNVDVDRNLSNS